MATRTGARTDAGVHATTRAAASCESPVLVAGGRPSSRAAVLRDLTETLPSNTRFGEARAAWELLALAPDSRMVVLSGDLGDISAKSAMHMLAHHHPEVPVVRLDARA
ncbi:MAG: hypothetical protein ACHQHO_00505 [Solirubrobacterales bacterium]